MNKRRGVKYSSLFFALVLVAASFSFTQAASLDELQQQKDALKQQMEANQAAAENKKNEAYSLSKQITNLDGDINSTQKKVEETTGQIDATQKNINTLSTQIDQKNKELAALKTKLNGSIREIYRSSSRSDYELILGSSSLSDAVNQEKYIQAVEVQVKSLYSKQQDLKKQLDDAKSQSEAKKNELDQMKAQQQERVNSANYQKSQKDKLLGMTVGQQKDYEQQVAGLKTEITKISSQIYAERQKRLSGGREILGGGGSGYPYSSIDEPDAWGFLTRECTSYAAWYLNVVAGTKFVNTRPGQGSAYNWPNLARDQGLTVSSSPKVGAAISWEAGSLTSGWGHVAIVEAINGDGTIDVSEFNWIRYSYSYRKNVTPSDYGSYSYIY